MADRPKLIRVWDDTVAPHYTTCRAPNCQARIWWARTVANDKPICFDHVPVAKRLEPVPSTGTGSSFRTVRFVDYDMVHWARCPGAQGFRRPV